MAKFLHLKETHPFEKFDLFADLANLRATVRRTDLRGISERTRWVFEVIESRLDDPVPEHRTV